MFAWNRRRFCHRSRRHCRCSTERSLLILAYLICLFFYLFIFNVNCLYIDNTIIVSPRIYPSLFLALVVLLVFIEIYTSYDRNDDIWKFLLIHLIDISDRQIGWMEQMRCYTKKERGKKAEVFMSSDILTVHTIGGCKCKWRNSRYTHYKTNMPIIVLAMSVSSSSLYNISWRKKVRQGGGGLHKSGSYTYI